MVFLRQYSTRFLILLHGTLAWLGAMLRLRVVGQTMVTAAQAHRTHPLSSKCTRAMDRLRYDLTRFVVVGPACIAMAVLVVGTRGLLTVRGRFGAAFGLGARPPAGDCMSGTIYHLKELDPMGNKVDVMGDEGTVEDIGVRTSTLRASTGELDFVPNGEIRQARNFARGSSSEANVLLRIAAAQRNDAWELLDAAVVDARRNSAQLLAQPPVITAASIIGDTVDVTLGAKADCDHGADVRRRLLQEAQQALTTLTIHVQE